MTRLRAVIVDWAGTIVDFGSSAPAASFIELFRRHGVDITVPEARAPMGMGKRDHIRAISVAVAQRWEARHGSACTEDVIDRMYAEFVPLQIEAIGKRAALIPGAREAVAGFRERGLAVGSTTGYSREMVTGLERSAAQAGLRVDTVVTASDVSHGRPAPWMALEAARRMAVYPMRGIVKIGDTVADIDEGLNAGMWTVAVAATGNEMGLDVEELEALPSDERTARLGAIKAKLLGAGAHYVVDGIADAHAVFDEIESRLSDGERP